MTLKMTGHRQSIKPVAHSEKAVTKHEFPSMTAILEIDCSPNRITLKEGEQITVNVRGHEARIKLVSTSNDAIMSEYEAVHVLEDYVNYLKLHQKFATTLYYIPREACPDVLFIGNTLRLSTAIKTIDDLNAHTVDGNTARQLLEYIASIHPNEEIRIAAADVLAQKQQLSKP